MARRHGDRKFIRYKGKQWFITYLPEEVRVKTITKTSKKTGKPYKQNYVVFGRDHGGYKGLFVPIHKSWTMRDVMLAIDKYSLYYLDYYDEYRPESFDTIDKDEIFINFDRDVKEELPRVLKLSEFLENEYQKKIDEMLGRPVQTSGCDCSKSYDRSYVMEKWRNDTGLTEDVVHMLNTL